MKSILAALFFLVFCLTAKAQSAAIPAEMQTLLTKYTCNTCHKLNEKLIGPSYLQIAAKGYTPKRIVELIYKPEPANWPTYPPMAALPQVPKKEAMAMAKWLAGLK